MSLHCCPTLLKYKNITAYCISLELKNPTDLSYIGSRLGHEDIRSSLNEKKCELLKKSQKSLNTIIFVDIYF
jgi:hypothetical protein